MDHKELLKRVDHTLLTPTAAWDQIQKLCDEGLTWNTCLAPTQKLKPWMSAIVLI